MIKARRKTIRYVIVKIVNITEDCFNSAGRRVTKVSLLALSVVVVVDVVVIIASPGKYVFTFESYAVGCNSV